MKMDVVEKFRHAVSDFSENIAISHGADSVSYAELDQLSDNIAAAVFNVVAGTKNRASSNYVVTFLEPGIDLVATILGVLKAGKVFVPVDPYLFQGRIQAIFAQTDVDAVITTQKWLGHLDAIFQSSETESVKKHQVLILGFGKSEDDVHIENIPAETFDTFPLEKMLITGFSSKIDRAAVENVDQNAYLYFTSGSTGTPKAILGRHSSLLHFIDWESSALGVDAKSRVSLLTPQTFDPFLRDVFLPLLNGGTLCIPLDREIVYAPVELLNWLVAQEITVMHTIPSLFELLLDHAGDTDCFRYLEFIALAGENLKASIVDKYYGFNPKPTAGLINLYGPTETTLAKLFYRVSAYDRIRDRIPVGKPISDTRVFILSEDGSLADEGQIGEVYIETEFMSAGYVNAPEEMAKSFVPHPLDDRDTIVYRTGDLGRCLSSGDIEIVGRTDFQIKIHGQRVEVGEIERALELHPGVKAAVVHCFGVGTYRQTLAAFLELKGRREVQAVEMAEFLKRYVPEYMLPSHYEVMASLPLLANGKIDRRALPAPCMERPPLAQNYQTPVSEEEKLICSLWEQILKLERVGKNDSFFEVGGRSIQAIGFLARLNKKLTVPLNIADFFSTPRVCDLAKLIEVKLVETKLVETKLVETKLVENKQDNPLSSTPSIQRAPHDFSEASLEQRRLWFFQQLNPSSPVYNMPFKAVFSGGLNRPVLQRVLNSLFLRHEAFRTSFNSADGNPVPVIAAAQALALPVLEFATETLDLARNRATFWLQKAASTPFNLAQGPLVRVALLTISPVENWLFINMHHIIADAWSVDVFWRELLVSYQALSQGKEHSLPPVELTFRDYVFFQKRKVDDKALSDTHEYWLRKLSGAPPLLQLPMDKPRPKEQTYAGARVKFSIPSSVSTGLRKFAQEEKATLFMLLMAAFKALLYRYTHQCDLVVGTPVANRSEMELESIIGFLVNILVFRSQLQQHYSMREFLRVERATVLEAFRHQNMTFDNLVQQLQPRRNLSYSPIFQIMFAFQETAPAATRLRGVEIGLPEQLDNGASKYDLTLQMWDQGNGFEAEFEYSTDLFVAESIERLAVNFQTLLAELVQQPDTPISRLALISPKEQRLLLEWNKTDKPFQSNHCIHELIDAQAEKTPELPAVVFGEQQLTYRQLQQQSNQLADYLIANGVRPGMPVAISIDRSLSLVIGFLAILKAGAIYVPVDPDYPAQRRQYILRDSTAGFLLTQKKYQQHYCCYNLKMVFIDTDWPAIGKRDTGAPTTAVMAESSAYVIYTSGSTGNPKGVEIRHRGVCNLAEEEVVLLRIGEGSRVLQFASFSFDTSIWEIVMTLSSGACLVMAERLALLPGPELLGVLRRQRVTHVTLPASALAVLPLDPLPDLRVLAVAGEACTLDLVRKWAPGRHFVNSYGPTETTVSATNAILSAEDCVVHIGRPLANTRVWVLDDELQQVPIGVAGELYIGGVGLARGYFKRPELSAERFIDNPHSAGKIYKTGDLVRFLADGNIEFLGLKDNQVKVRGFRIELGEIEFVLKTHGAVQDAVVLLREDSGDNQCLVAYVVEQPAASVVQEQLYTHIQEQLPDYMLPAAFVIMDAFPRLPNNKIDRASLPAPAASRHGLCTSEYIEPATEMERIIASVWQQVLGLNRVGVTQSFFHLGGHSLLATRVASVLHNQYGIALSVREFFSTPTVRALAAVAAVHCVTQAPAPAAVNSSAANPRLPEIASVAEFCPVPLTFSQQRLWFLSQLQPQSPDYNICTIKHFIGSINTGVLIHAINSVLENQSIFRHTFLLEDGVPLQLLRPEPQPLCVETLTCANRDQWMMQIQQRADVLAATAFDLLNGLPPYHLVLFTGKDQSQAGLPLQPVLVLVIHHILIDEQSLDIFDQQIISAYRDLHAGAAVDSRETAGSGEIRYIDYANWEREQFSSNQDSQQYREQNQNQNQRRYWEKQFAHLPPVLPLPYDGYERVSLQRDQGGAVIPLSLPATVSRRLTAYAEAGNATPFIVLLSGFYALLYRYTGVEEICIGTPVSVRPYAELDSTIGLFLNTLALKVRLPQGQTFEALFDAVKQSVLEGLENKELPFDKVVEAVCPERNSQTPLFNTMFVYQHKASTASERDCYDSPETVIEVLSREVESGTAKFDLTVFIWEEQGQFKGKVEFNTRRFQSATIERLVGHLSNIYSAVAANPGQKICELALLSDTEVQTLLCDWNRTRVPVASLCAHQVFESRVRLYPQAVAVQYKDCLLSYEALNDRANQLAHYLLNQGIGRDSLVGILLPRNVNLVVSVLGVLKAGAAYVPIDPEYPQQRLQYLIEDAELAELLTESQLTERLSDIEVETVVLDQQWNDISEFNSDNPDLEVSARDLAYVIYTSGSTGKPKGVLIEHVGLSNYLAYAVDEYSVAGGSGCPVHSSIAFDATITSLYTPLLTGRKLILIEEENEIQALSEVLVRERDLSLVKITPAHLDIISHSLPAAAAANVRALIIGGEALNYGALEFWRKNAPNTRIINEYGPTETVVGCCVFEVPVAGAGMAHSRAEQGGGIQGGDSRGIVPIGKPINNIQLYILDRDSQPVPVGIVGELYIGGAGVARGYHRRETLTAQRFIENPLVTGGGARGERLYRTGDLAKYYPDGNIVFLGRMDSQVKIRGFRVERGEVEACLVEHPLVLEAAVKVVETVNRQLVAYIVADALHDAFYVELRDYLAKKLPDYMLPAHFISLDEMPLTPNGKIDKQALPDLDMNGEGRGYTAPGNKKETILVEIWKQVLRRDTVGVKDNFFELGGDSILSLQIVFKAKQKGLQINPRQLFEYQNIAALAAVAGHEITSGAGQGITSGEVAITPIQYWLFSHQSRHFNHFNQSYLFEIDRTVDRLCLERAFRAVINHHDGLRMTFSRREDQSGEQWTANIEPAFDAFSIEEVFCTGKNVAEEKQFIESAARERQKRFDLAVAPLLKVTHFKTQYSGGDRLLIVAHHLVVDNVSWQIILDDIQTVYAAQGAASVLPPKSTSLKSWSEKLRQYAVSETLAAEIPYWRALGDNEQTRLPLDAYAGHNCVRDAKKVVITFSRKETADLLDNCAFAYKTRVNELLWVRLHFNDAFLGSQQLRSFILGCMVPLPFLFFVEFPIILKIPA